MLNERGIPSPGRYRFEHGIVTNNNKKGSSLLWNRHALTDILRNIVYIGHLAQGKCTASLARGIPVHRTPESEWDIAYHTHDPIITGSFSIRYKKSPVRGQMPIMPIMEPAATSPRVITPIGKDWSVRTAGHK